MLDESDESVLSAELALVNQQLSEEEHRASLRGAFCLHDLAICLQQESLKSDLGGVHKEIDKLLTRIEVLRSFLATLTPSADFGASSQHDGAAVIPVCA